MCTSFSLTTWGVPQGVILPAVACLTGAVKPLGQAAPQWDGGLLCL
jgi:hypothetical protein